MNRRSFLGLLPIAPFAAPAIAKEAAADITQLIVRSRAIAKVNRMFGPPRVQPQIASLGLSVDSSELERAVAALRGIPTATRAALSDHMAGAAERGAVALSRVAAAEDEYPSPDILPI